MFARRRFLWVGILVVVLAVACVLFRQSITKSETQVELSQHVTKKYGDYLRMHGITEVDYDVGTWKTSEELTANGRSVDLSFHCPSVCRFEDVNTFEVQKVGDGYTVFAKIDRTQVRYDDAENQFDATMDDILHEYDTSQAVIASWKQAKQ